MEREGRGGRAGCRKYCGEGSKGLQKAPRQGKHLDALKLDQDSAGPGLACIRSPYADKIKAWLTVEQVSHCQHNLYLDFLQLEFDTECIRFRIGPLQ